MGIRSRIFNGTSSHIEHVPSALFDDTFEHFITAVDEISHSRGKSQMNWQNTPVEMTLRGLLIFRFSSVSEHARVGSWNARTAFVAALASTLQRRRRENPGLKKNAKFEMRLEQWGLEDGDQCGWRKAFYVLEAG